MAAVAAWMLPGSGPIPRPRTEVEGAALVTACAAHRLLGSLAAAGAEGRLELPEGAAAELRDRHRGALAWCLQVEARLLEVRDWFARADVDHLVLKGPAQAHLDEPDPALRSFADLDLLVRAEHLDRAVAVLTAHGATRPWPERRPGFDRRFAKSVTMTGSDGVELDLHRTLCDGVHGVRIPRDRLFAAAGSFELGGERVPCLARDHRLLHSAYHAVLGSPVPPLRSLRDLAGLLTAPDLELHDVVAEARRWRGEAVLHAAVQSTVTTLSFTAPEWRAWAHDTSVPRHERELVDRQRREGSSFGRAKLDAWRELPSARDRSSYALALVVPTAEHLRARSTNRRRVWTTAWGRVRPRSR